MPEGFLKAIVGCEAANDKPNKKNIDIGIEQWENGGSEFTFPLYNP